MAARFTTFRLVSAARNDLISAFFSALANLSAAAATFAAASFYTSCWRLPLSKAPFRPPSLPSPRSSLRQPPRSPPPQQLALQLFNLRLPRALALAPRSRRILHLETWHRCHPSSGEPAISPTHGADSDDRHFLKL